jgi:SAM-dependent methyltransferase
MSLARKLFGKLKILGFIGTLDAVLDNILAILIPERIRLPLWGFDNWYRFKNAFRLLDREGAASHVLDVGGGGGGFAKYARDFPVVVCEPDSGAVEFSARKGALTIRASGTDLPFPDRSFRNVVSLHVFEHIPAKQRQRFISEITRVCATKLVFICPEGKWSEELSKRVIAFWIRNKIPVPLMARQHLVCGVPGYQEVLAGIDQGEWKVEYFHSRNYYLDLLYFGVSQIPIFRLFALPFLSLPMVLLARVPPGVELTLIASRNSEGDY